MPQIHPHRIRRDRPLAIDLEAEPDEVPARAFTSEKDASTPNIRATIANQNRLPITWLRIWNVAS